jgi:hypothetical protein
LRFGYAFVDRDGSTIEVQENLFCYPVEAADSPGTDEHDGNCRVRLASGPDAMIRARNECVEYALYSWLSEREWPIDRAFWRYALSTS